MAEADDCDADEKCNEEDVALAWGWDVDGGGSHAID